MPDTAWRPLAGKEGSEHALFHALMIHMAASDILLADRYCCSCLVITQRCVGHRPGRIEPGAVRRRPKPFPRLTQPRPIACEKVRRLGHLKKPERASFDSAAIFSGSASQMLNLRYLAAIATADASLCA